MSEEEDLKERQRLYERTRDDLAASARSVSESYDRALLTLSSAFLGGSLAFVGQIVTLGSASMKWMLYLSWLLFAVTIILTVGSFIYGLLTFQQLRDAAERYYMRHDQDSWKVSDSVQRVVLRYVVSCGVSFVLGILFLVTFVSINLARETPTMSQEILKKSIPPATFQKPLDTAPAVPPTTPQTPQQVPATQTNQPKQSGS